MMDKNLAKTLLESGNARAVVLEAVILEYDGAVYLTFDGEEWEKVEIGIVRREVWS